MTAKSTFGLLSRRAVLRAGAAGASTLALQASLAGRALAASFTDGPVIETAAGRIRGLIDDDVQVYRGIPYGAPTGGLNRFLAPQKAPAWIGVFDAFQFGPIAPQFNPALGRGTDPMYPIDPPGLPESEDCLRLNIYTRTIAADARQPVMVWLHGGRYSSGAASMPVYQGEALARSDVVVVTINHRLGVLGFTHLGGLIEREFTSSGNASLLDIVLALEWVRDNIAAFGGDPANITVFGESSGGSKIACLMSMPAAKGLFHRAIIQSGPRMRVATAESADQTTRLLLAELGIAVAKARSLQQVPLDTLLRACFAVVPKLGSDGGFGPVVDGAALPRQPFDPDAPAMSADVPLLIGSTRHAATFRYQGPQQDLALDNAGLRQRVGALAGIDADRAIRLYRKADPKATPWQLFIRIATDHWITGDTIAIAERKSDQGAAPVYLYRFDRETTKLGGQMGATHFLDVPFVFNNLDRADWLVDVNDDNRALAQKMSRAWAAFARSGNPATPDLPAWPAYTTRARDTMIFNVASRVEQDPEREQRLLIAEALNRS